MNNTKSNSEHLLHSIDSKPQTVKKISPKMRRQKRLKVILALIGSLLMISGLVGSIICYLR